MVTKIYTDGSCSPNNGKGPGGWGFIMVENNKRLFSSFGGEFPSTNNRMEFKAAIMGINYAVFSKKESTEVITDSMLLVNTGSKWIHSWKKRGWKKKKGEAPKNLDLLIELDELMKKINVKFSWVKGHSGNHFNEIADGLALKGRKTKNKNWDCQVRSAKVGLANDKVFISLIEDDKVRNLVKRTIRK